MHRLLEKNANPSLPGATKWPPLAEAISVGQKESVVALIKASTQQMFDEVVRPSPRLPRCCPMSVMLV